MTYPQRKTCPACDAPVLLVAGSRRGGTPTAFDPDPRTVGDGYDTKLADDLSHVAVTSATHLKGHIPLYREHSVMTCPAGLRVPAGRACPSWAGYSQAAAGPRPPADPPSWPQPWDGINGTIRDNDDLLSLEDTAMPRRRLMVMMALSTYKATLVGNPAPIVEQMGKRMRNPEPGDLVVEVTTARRPDSEYRGFGILLVHRREWADTDEDWARETAGEPEWMRGNDNRPTGDSWYVQYGPGERDIAQWDNADFIAVLADGRPA